MDIIDLDRRTNITPSAGKLLIAEPFLTDPGFSRTVVFLCEHGEDGSIGFVLNRPLQNNLGELLPELPDTSLTLFQGGPVQHDTLHMVHRMPDLMGGLEISPGIYWGGSYTDLSGLIRSNNFSREDLRLFVGYAGWERGQLEQELKDGSWLVAENKNDILFQTDPGALWQESIRSLGSAYAYMANLPVHPQLN